MSIIHSFIHSLSLSFPPFKCSPGELAVRESYRYNRIVSLFLRLWDEIPTYISDGGGTVADNPFSVEAIEFSLGFRILQ